MCNLTDCTQVLKELSFLNIVNSMCGRIVRENHGQERELYADRNYAHYPRQDKRQGVRRFEAKAVNSEALEVAFVRIRTRSRSSY